MIGVCIKYFHENYGGMLQAYATISLLESKRIDYELIRYEKKKTPISVIKSLPRLFNGVLLNDKYEALIKQIGKKMHPEFAKNEAIRMKAFHDFEKSHFIKLSPIFKGYDELCKGVTRYTAVITGSDQLWSPAGLPTNFYNLQFVPDSIRKISYASSFGVKQIPWYQLKKTADFLSRIEYISMREIRGSEIVKELTGRIVPTVLDPVFMFDQTDWEMLVPLEKIVNEKYIFAYFLGNNSEHRIVVKNVAKQLGLKIVALRHLDQYVKEDEHFGDIAIYDAAPDKFLNLIRGADYICTDSFHGSCFSIIHKKQFVTFDRYTESSKHSKNSRIDTLCDNLGLQGRRYSNQSKFKEQLIEEIDYNKVIDKLSILKEQTNDYLDKALYNI